MNIIRYKVTKGALINKKGKVTRYIIDKNCILIGFKIGPKLIFPPINKSKWQKAEPQQKK